MLSEKEVSDYVKGYYMDFMTVVIAAGTDLYHWSEEDQVNFISRVNWYWDSQKEGLITLDYIRKVIKANGGLIIEKTNSLKGQTE